MNHYSVYRITRSLFGKRKYRHLSASCPLYANHGARRLCSTFQDPDRQSIGPNQKLSDGNSVKIKFNHPNARPLEISCDSLARFANGSAVVSQGGTSVLVTAVSRSKASPTGSGFVPLSVEYRQKAAAAGRIPTNHLRREIGQSEREILVSRMIDRAVRPLFPSGFSNDTQLVCTLLSMDSIHDPEVLALNGASAALSVSSIPWMGPIGAVRVGYMPGEEIVINPTRRELSNSLGSIIVAAMKNKSVIMMDGGSSGGSILMPRLNQMIATGIKESAHIINGIQELANESKSNKIIPPNSKTSTTSSSDDQNLNADQNMVHDTLYSIAQIAMRDILLDSSHDKTSRDDALSALREKAVIQVKEAHPELDLIHINDVFSRITREIHTETVFETNQRSDGRTPYQIRPLSARVNLFEPLHGSAIFQRGQTQVLCTTTFDSIDAAFRTDIVTSLLSGVKEKNFMLHYEFPQFAVGDLARPGGGHANRRELGHGALAERALRPVIPEKFPFSVRLSCEVLESNGSSSMASVCAGSMALMDAGVGIPEPVAGVAIGLLARPSSSASSTSSVPTEESDTSKNGDGDRYRISHDGMDYLILTDLMGMEDYLGEMDFKIAGTKRGVTALQLDCKLPTGLPWPVVERAITAAHTARQHIINFMNEVIHEPRLDKKDVWPVNEKLKIPPHKRSALIGVGGSNLKRIQLTTGVQINFDPLAEDGVGSFSVFAPNQLAMSEVREAIDKLLVESDREPQLDFGSIYTAHVVEVRENGLMVILYPNMQPTLLHNNQLDIRKVSHPSAIGLEIGSEIQVKYFGRDPVTGTMRLSRKVLQTAAVPRLKNHLKNVKNGSTTETSPAESQPESSEPNRSPPS